ncbi:MAG: hypothetical protein IPJ77_22135 [Planctomycetes bacterium]|nr:hypothetical protein [Planctomycetota bacterium]
MKISIALGVLGLALASCASSPWRPFRYAPAPLEARLDAQGDSNATARVLVTVLGLARDGGAAHVRVRIENLGARPVRLVPESLALLTADLAPFESARVEPAPLPIQGGESGTYEAVFAPPAGRSYDELDLHGLNLRSTLDFDGIRVTAGATFTREEPLPWDRDPYPYPRFHVGFGFVHCR